MTETKVFVVLVEDDALKAFREERSAIAFMFNVMMNKALSFRGDGFDVSFEYGVLDEEVWGNVTAKRENMVAYSVSYYVERVELL